VSGGRDDQLDQRVLVREVQLRLCGVGEHVGPTDRHAEIALHDHFGEHRQMPRYLAAADIEVTTEGMLIDRALSRFDFTRIEHEVVDADPAATYGAVRAWTS
jgi:hypothetical protein